MISLLKKKKQTSQVRLKWEKETCQNSKRDARETKSGPDEIHAAPRPEAGIPAARLFPNPLPLPLAPRSSPEGSAGSFDVLVTNQRQNQK